MSLSLMKKLILEFKYLKKRKALFFFFDNIIMQKVDIKPLSPKQLSKLRNGHKVRVYRPIEGNGMSLYVNPMNYNQMTRSFYKDSGTNIYLSPEELDTNRSVEGGSLFGKKFKKGLKSIGKALSSPTAIEIYKDTAKTALPILLKAALSSNSSNTKPAPPQPTTGKGLYLRGSGVMGKNTLLNYTNNNLPPALQSQNEDANFFLRTQMPPYLKGKGLYL